MRRIRCVSRSSLPAALVALTAALCCASAISATAPRSVAPWPFHRLVLGLSTPPGSASAERRSAPLSAAYVYLSGGVNTGHGWRTWANGDGDYVSEYISASEHAQMVPVFSYYQIRQSSPGDELAGEAAADLENLDDRSTMRAYYRDLTAFFRDAAGASGPVILQMEPDLWGYIEQSAHGDAANVRAAVASSGIAVLRGLPDNASGFARAVLRLRDIYAPHVIVAYHDSIWGTGTSIQQSHPTDARVDSMAAQSIRFYRSLRARFDAVFTETSNSDSGYAQLVEGAGRSQWWQPSDFQHLRRYVAVVDRVLKLPMVIWQIPVGNTIMRVMDNRPYHYQDNKVQSLLADTPVARALLGGYARAGVSALLFGSPEPTDTCACDNDHNRLGDQPQPIDGNARRSYTDADDGGYFMHVARDYYARGLLRVR